jgi:hypothetical protein
MPTNNFGGFTEFFLKGMNTFKIQKQINFVGLPEFGIQILLGI